MTGTHVLRAWQDLLGRAVIHVGLFTPDHRPLAAEQPLSDLLQGTAAHSLELHALQEAPFSLRLRNSQHSVSLRFPASLTPDAARPLIARALEIGGQDFRLTLPGGARLSSDQPLSAQGLADGGELLADPRLRLEVHFDDARASKSVQCFASETIVAVREQLGLRTEEAVLSAASPHRRLLADTEPVGGIRTPRSLLVERKVPLSFESIAGDYPRQQVAVALSAPPLDIYDALRERFGLTTELRLLFNGQALENGASLRTQGIASGSVIQIDSRRPRVVSNAWSRCQEEVLAFSSEHAATASVRDEERRLPMLANNGVARCPARAKSMLREVAPGAHQEVLRWGRLLPSGSAARDLSLTEQALLVLNPVKLFVRPHTAPKKFQDRKLRICRFPSTATFADVRESLRQGRQDIELRRSGAHGARIAGDELTKRVRQEVLWLERVDRFQTRLTVQLDGRSYHCSFEAAKVRFTDVVVSVGKQAKLPPRHLFTRPLFCTGCRRRLSKDEEQFQAVPSDCCRQKSLTLTDCRVKGEAWIAF